MVTYVEEIRGVLSLQMYDTLSCETIIAYAEKSNAWSAATIGKEDGGNHLSEVRPHYRAASSFSPAQKSPLQRNLARKVNELLCPLINEAWRTDLKRHTDTHVVRYLPGGFYVTHADTGLDLDYRYFTVLCYLNEDFQGGQTCFPTLNFSVTPQKGKGIVFPATYLHRAEPVMQGTKYILVTWLSGPDPPHWI
jgi:predicted 2-oxoglutarate/Fe(II)-dependent dioxygenase YbiX